MTRLPLVCSALCRRGALLHRHCSCFRLDSLEDKPSFLAAAEAAATTSVLASLFAERCRVPFPSEPPPSWVSYLSGAWRALG
eukprot:4565044-Pyramimonas_sp.AAC.1